MIVAVTGATGIVGRFIVEKLLGEGQTVRAWRRKGSDLTGMPGAIKWVDGALGDQKAATALLDGAEMLVHAALDHLPGRYRGGEGDDLGRFMRVNVGGSLDLLAAARAAGVRRCVVLSSRAVFGESSAGLLDDDARTAPDTHYGAAKAALEAFVQSWGFGEGWAVAALRPTGVYGLVRPVERSKWFELVRSAVRGEPVPPRCGTEVHGRDVAVAVWLLLTADAGDVAGRAFNCSDVVVSARDLVSAVQRIAGVSGPLPAESPPPRGIMTCPRLAALGLRFGGPELLQSTIKQLVSAARAHDGEPGKKVLQSR